MIDSSFKNSESAIWFHLSTKSGFYKIPRHTSSVRLLSSFFVLLVSIFLTKNISQLQLRDYFFLEKKIRQVHRKKEKKTRYTPVHPAKRQASARSSRTWREGKTSTRSFVAQCCSDGAARGLEKISLHLKAVIGTNQLCGECVAVADASAHTRSHSRAQTEQEWHKQFPVFQTWSVDVRWFHILLHSLADFPFSLLPAVVTGLYCLSTRARQPAEGNRWHAYVHMNITDRIALFSWRRTCLANEKTRYAELFARWCSRQ